MANDETEAEEADTVIAFNPSMTHRLTGDTRVLLARDSDGAWVVIWADCEGALEGEDSGFMNIADTD